LAPGTKNYLHRLAVAEKFTDVRVVDDADSISPIDSDIETQGDKSAPPRRLVRVPLSSDSDFFSLLEKDLCNIAGLQAARKRKLTEEIVDVAKALGRATNPELSSKSKHDLAQWRRLFELYLQSNVFFAMNEQDHGTQSGCQARDRFAKFLDMAQKSSLVGGFKLRESSAALQNFVAINTELLQFVGFWEINQLATVKILKSTIPMPRHTSTDQERIRQKDRSGSEAHVSNASTCFIFIPRPFKGSVGRGVQQDPRRGAPA
jgi:E3 ubiquitin-protein ligase BAH